MFYDNLNFPGQIKKKVGVLRQRSWKMENLKIPYSLLDCNFRLYCAMKRGKQRFDMTDPWWFLLCMHSIYTMSKANSWNFQSKTFVFLPHFFQIMFHIILHLKTWNTSSDLVCMRNDVVVGAEIEKETVTKAWDCVCPNWNVAFHLFAIFNVCDVFFWERLTGFELLCRPRGNCKAYHRSRQWNNDNRGLQVFLGLNFIPNNCYQNAWYKTYSCLCAGSSRTKAR